MCIPAENTFPVIDTKNYVNEISDQVTLLAWAEVLGATANFPDVTQEWIWTLWHREYPLREKYEFSPDKCRHNFNFVVYCDGEWDIVRCSKCGGSKLCGILFPVIHRKGPIMKKKKVNPNKKPLASASAFWKILLISCG